ncbi:MAG: hypothetical protein COS14_01950 [Bacteroidetes bacterium CG02_land_8_20_14_3_00_31_25]|nr:MAG: hypothetical protein COS14_01950 [Bacteroidetes bacterium CG02_land_8_20_14_3_00_31_25]
MFCFTVFTNYTFHICFFHYYTLHGINYCIWVLGNGYKGIGYNPLSLIPLYLIPLCFLVFMKC